MSQGIYRDLTGQVFGRLTAIRLAGRTPRGLAIWLCRCSCDGKEVTVRGSSLMAKYTKSCGCLRRELAVAARRRESGIHSHAFRHGHSLSSGWSPVYRTWVNVVLRCTNPNASHYEYYGGAGVKICDRWRNSFEAFLEDMGDRPEGTTLGRFGDTGNYEPGNCAWQNRKEQVAEQRTKRLLAVLDA
jgi:hypothetical protein